MNSPQATRVLFVLGSLAGGGAERIVTYLVNHLDRGEFDARVGVLWRHGPYVADVRDGQLLVPRLMHGWIEYRDRPVWWRLLPSLLTVPIQQHELLRRFRPHVVVTATKSMNVAARFSLAAFGRRDVAWIAREGNNTGAMIDDESRGALRALEHGTVGSSYRQADRIVAISQGVAHGLVRRFHVDPARVRVVPNAVDLETVRRRAQEPLDPPFDRPFIVAAGRLDPQKGFDVLLRAYAKCAAARDCALVVLGDGAERTALAQLAVTLGIANRVHFPGFVANPWAWFARARLFVSASRWEGFGNVIIEAMASGAPVVATDCDFGPREILEHDTSGLLVPVDDVEAVAVAMDGLLQDGERAARLAAGGRARAERFGLEPLVERYAAVFRELRPAVRR